MILFDAVLGAGVLCNEPSMPVPIYTVTPATTQAIHKNTVLFWGLGSFIVPHELVP